MLVDAQAQAPAQGLAALALGAHVAQRANLEHVGVVPAFPQGRVREDELQRRRKRQQLFLLFHDQVVGPLGVLAVAGVVLCRVLPAAFFVDGKIAVVYFLGGAVQVNFGKQALKSRQPGSAPVFLFKNARVVAFDRLATFVVLAVALHRVNEEQRQHLDALGPQQCFFLQMLADGAANHLALHGQRIDVAVRLPQRQKGFAIGKAQLQKLAALGGVDLAHPKVAVNGALGGLLQIVPIAHGDFLAPDAVRRLDIQLHPGADAAALVAHRHQPHKSLVVCVFHCRRRHLDLLDQLALVGVQRVKAVHHVVLVGVRGRIAQRAQRVHRSQRLFATAFQAAVHALRLVHDEDGSCLPDEVNRLFAAGLFAVFVEVVDILLVDGTHRHHHYLNGAAGGKVAHLAQLARVVQKEVHRHPGIQAPEMLLRDLQRLVHALLDGHRGHDDDELGEAIAPVQLKNGAQIHIGLAGAGFHLHREIARMQLL